MAAHMPRVRLAGGPARVYKTRRTHLLARSNTLSVYPDSLLDSKLNVGSLNSRSTDPSQAKSESHRSRRLEARPRPPVLDARPPLRRQSWGKA
eukprot:scaffold72714_cov36-Phaeocystis_antarctica.AAC.1